MNYYKDSYKLLNEMKIERAITGFCRGLDTGCAKCAYGILDAVVNCGSHTMSEDEAIRIFQNNYPYIKSLAEEGDSDAMVIMAESIRHGFSEDDEPYFLWLHMASALGNPKAAALLSELEIDELPALQAAQRSSADLPVAAGASLPMATGATNIGEEVYDPSSEVVLMSEPDFLLREELGLIPAAASERDLGEIMKSSAEY